MNSSTLYDLSATLHDFTLTSLQNDASDLALLQWMLHRLATTLESFKRMNAATLPFSTHVQEFNRLQHDMVLDQPQHLDSERELRFLSLVGKKRRHLEPYLLQIAGNLGADLASLPGIVSHSSLVLPDGNMCSLMLYASGEVQDSLLTMADQQLNADQLTRQYYKWIRMHSGIILRERQGQQTILPGQTRYYSFHQSSNIPLPGVLYTWSDRFRTTSDL